VEKDKMNVLTEGILRVGSFVFIRITNTHHSFSLRFHVYRHCFRRVFQKKLIPPHKLLLVKMFSSQCGSVDLPVEVLLDNVFPYLDRSSFNALAMTSQQLHKASKTISPPWPDRLVSQQDPLCRMRCIAFSPSNTRIAGGCSDGSIRQWHVRSGELHTQGHGHWPGEGVTSIVYSPNGKYLASASTDHTIKVMNVQEQKIIRMIHASHVSCLRFAPDDDNILVSGHHSAELIQFWNVSDGTCIQRLRGDVQRVVSLQLFPNDENRLVSADNQSNIKVWNLTDGTFERWKGGYYNAISPACNSDGGVQVASVHGEDHAFRVWNTQTSNPSSQTRQFDNIHPHEITFSPNGQKVASVDDFRAVKIWSVEDGSLLSTLEDSKVLSFHIFSYHGITFSPDSNIIAVVSRNKNLVRLFHT
jgi:WD40 repeat protein